MYSVSGRPGEEAPHSPKLELESSVSDNTSMHSLFSSVMIDIERSRKSYTASLLFLGDKVGKPNVTDYAYALREVSEYFVAAQDA